VNYWKIVLVAVWGALAWGLDDIPEEEPPKWFSQLEIGPVFQSRNDVRIPNDTGTLVSLKDFSQKVTIAGRIYLGYRWTEKSDFRLLFAPLSLNGSANNHPTFSFQGTTFYPAWPIVSLYRFNSYRLSYRYLFHEKGPWRLWVGFTAKIRDAEIAFSQRDDRASKKDLGFVPLLYFRALYLITPRSFVDLDVDALAAPQGRAEDVALRYWFPLGDTVQANVGYRLLEGGADNDKVFTFAFLHYLVAGLQFRF